jgi:hypothetical protein
MQCITAALCFAVRNGDRVMNAGMDRGLSEYCKPQPQRLERNSVNTEDKGWATCIQAMQCIAGPFPCMNEVLIERSSLATLK